jgi:diadenosine tetraphosphate (Ap4A) HIT family hydrolase
MLSIPSLPNAACPLCINHNHNAVDAASTHTIFANEHLQIVWANEVNYPCFVRVIWQQHVAEMTDLSNHEQLEVMRVVLLVERAMRDTLQPTPSKINLASFGNYVPHLHWHIIPRAIDDAHWPDSVFTTPKRSIDAAQLAHSHAQRGALAAAIVLALQIYRSPFKNWG